MKNSKKFRAYVIMIKICLAACLLAVFIEANYVSIFLDKYFNKDPNNGVGEDGVNEADGYDWEGDDWDLS
jgi:hypothetical protein